MSVTPDDVLEFKDATEGVWCLALFLFWPIFIHCGFARLSLPTECKYLRVSILVICHEGLQDQGIDFQDRGRRTFTRG